MHSTIKLLFNHKINIYINDNYYMEKLLNEIKQGKETLHSKNGNIKNDGNFVNGKFEGKGTYIWEKVNVMWDNEYII